MGKHQSFKLYNDIAPTIMSCKGKAFLEWALFFAEASSIKNAMPE